MPFDLLNTAFKAVRDVQSLVLRTAKTAIGQIHTVCATDDASLWYSIRVNNEDGTKARVADEQVSLLVNSETIWSCRTERVEKDAGFGGSAIVVEWQAPYLIGSSHGHKQDFLVAREHQPIRRDAITHQLVELAARAQTVYFTSLVSHACLALVGEVNVALRVDDKVVGSFEPLKVATSHVRLDRSGRGVTDQYTLW